MLCWAGYRQPDGTVIGDPANADFTEVSHRRIEQVEQVKQGNVFFINSYQCKDVDCRLSERSLAIPLSHLLWIYGPESTITSWNDK